jgi:hypothetical protein
VKRPQKTQEGVVLVFVLLALFLGASIGSALLFLRYQGAIAGRERPSSPTTRADSSPRGPS